MLATLSKVMDTNPDHLEAQGLELIYTLLDSQVNTSLHLEYGIVPSISGHSLLVEESQRTFTFVVHLVSF